MDVRRIKQRSVGMDATARIGGIYFDEMSIQQDKELQKW